MRKHRRLAVPTDTPPADDLKAALEPRSVAVIGASTNPNKIGGRPIAYMTRFGYRGKIYPINPNSPEVQGHKSYPDLAALPEAPDLVVVAVGLLGDQFEQENDAAAAASVALVNFAWPVAALAEVRRRLVAQGFGRILVISSVASIRVRRNAYLYGGAKAGLDRLCVGMAESLEGTGVRLQLLRPGVVRTRMTKGQAPVPFTTGPEEVAGYVMKGLSTNDLVIWSPPVLRYAFAVLRHLPRPIWSKVADR